jgi:hypothetical protein
MASSSNSDAAAPAAVMPTGCAAMSRAEFNTYTLYRALRSPGFSADWCAEFIRRCGPRNFTFYLGKEHGYVSLAESLVLDRSVEGYAEEYEPFRSASSASAASSAGAASPSSPGGVSTAPSCTATSALERIRRPAGEIQ